MRYCLCLLMAFLFINVTHAQKTPVTKANYSLAARYSPKKVEKLVFSTSVDPHWLKKSDRFWYTYETPNGKNWYIVDPSKGDKRLLFDNAKLAAELTKIV